MLLKRIFTIVSLLLLPALSKAATIYFTAAGITVAMLDSSAAVPQVSRPDEYNKEHIPFDLSIRFDKKDGLTEQDYLSRAANDVHNWPGEEQQQIRDAFAGIDKYAVANKITLHLPDTVMLIKTTGKVEFGAEGWTRRNLIMLNTGAMPISLHLMAHELFHVLSRNDKATRDAAYAVFHFKPCNNIIYKPAMHNKVITNPDCPFLMHYITLTIKDHQQDAVLVLYSKNDYTPGASMGEYINIGLLALTGDDQHKAPLIKDGEPVIYELGEVPDLYKKIGKNTQYVLHVEEISAEHFASLMAGKQVKQPEYVEGMAKALKDRG